MITVTYSDSATASFDADRWQLLRGVDSRQVTMFTADVELFKGTTPVAVIGAGTFFSIMLEPAVT